MSYQEEILCRIRFTAETTIMLDEFNLEHPFEILYVREDDNRRFQVATIQPPGNDLPTDHRILSLTLHVGNKARIKTFFRYNGREKEFCGPDIEWPVRNYGDGYIQVKSNGNL